MIVCKQANDGINKEKILTSQSFNNGHYVPEKKLYYGLNLKNTEGPLRGILHWFQAEVLTHISVTC